MKRQKTNYKYYTCNAPENTNMLIKYLKTKKKAIKHDKLLDISDNGITTLFYRLNKKLGNPQSGNYGVLPSTQPKKISRLHY